MDVLYWQGFVAVTVLLTRMMLGVKATVWLCVGWTAWSFVMIGYPVLAILQSITAWGSFLALSSFMGTSKRAERLERAVAEKDHKIAVVSEAERAARRDLEELKSQLASAGVPSRIVSIADRHGATKPLFGVVEGEEHRKHLLDALESSDHWICITSGWIGSAALDRSFLAGLRIALNRHVNVYLAFGWESSDGTHVVSGRARQALEALSKIARTCRKGKLVVGRYPNHEKMLVTPKFLIAGSYNWLSNLELRNAERSIRVEDPAISEVEGERLKALIVRNALDPSSTSPEPGAYFPFGTCLCGAPIREAAFVYDGWCDDEVEGNGFSAKCSQCDADLSCPDDGKWRWAV